MLKLKGMEYTEITNEEISGHEKNVSVSLVAVKEWNVCK